MFSLLMCTICVPGTHGGPKKVLGSSGLELQVVLSGQVGAGIEPRCPPEEQQIFLTLNVSQLSDLFGGQRVGWLFILLV